MIRHALPTSSSSSERRPPRAVLSSLAGFLAGGVLLAGTTGCDSLGAAGTSTWMDRTWKRIIGISLEEALAGINSNSPDIRRESVVFLSQDKRTRTRPDLHAVLAEGAFGGKRADGKFYAPDPDVQVRVACLTGLRLNDVALTAEQLDLLRGGLDVADETRPGGRDFNRSTVWLRYETCEALAKWPHDAGTDRLVTALRSDPEPDVRLAAARALGKARPGDAMRRTAVAEALVEHVDLRDGRPFSLKYESLQTLEELTGEGEVDFDQEGWRKWFAGHAADPWARAGVLPVRVPVQRSFWQRTADTIDRLLYFVRKPARSED